eukprot:TRINITY_DN67322_c4_g3_i1.p1 TRINITY_DN67322_c4_g3~~TRINITY_DN67322_c4_g3_i1.p1  ORF type:complete len:208 (-),score=16.26 TRINITY_DN67322_c4_g3_i1:194-754(-)
MSMAEFYIDNGIDPSDPNSMNAFLQGCAEGHSDGAWEYAGLKCMREMKGDIHTATPASDITKDKVTQFLQDPFFRQNEATFQAAADDARFSEVTLLAAPNGVVQAPHNFPTPMGGHLTAYVLHNKQQLSSARKACKVAGVVPVRLKPKQWLFVQKWADCDGKLPPVLSDLRGWCARCKVLDQLEEK